VQFCIWIQPDIDGAPIQLLSAGNLNHIYDPMTNLLMARFYHNTSIFQSRKEGYLKLQYVHQVCFVHVLFESTPTTLEWKQWCHIQHPQSFASPVSRFESYSSSCTQLNLQAELLKSEFPGREQFILRISKL